MLLVLCLLYEKARGRPTSIKEEEEHKEEKEAAEKNHLQAKTTVLFNAD